MFQVTAWCRADFAGGTLDIWPLGLLHPGARTVNVALDLPVEVVHRPRQRGYSVRQEDRLHDAPTAEALRADPETALIGEIALAVDLAPCDLVIRSASPRGAGLGASSALSVALLGAGEVAAHGDFSRDAESRAALARDLEARLMSLPTGLQDHYPAQLGGVLDIEHAPGGEVVRRLGVDLDALGDRLLVAFTGQSHFSAGANWHVIRRRLDGDAAMVARLDRVRDAARELPSALEASDWRRAGELVAAEWSARRELSSEVSTPRIEELLDAGRELGAWGGKAGGAGGGGCVFALVPPERRAAVALAWERAGARLLPARPTERGLELTR